MVNVTYISGLFSDTYHVKPHQHQTYELIYYTQGTGYVDIGSHREPFYPGFITIIAPGVVHTDYADGGFRNIHLNLIHPGFRVDEYIKLSDSQNRDIYKILFQMHNEYHVKRKNCAALMNSLYAVLLEYMAAFMDSPPKSKFVDLIVRDIVVNISNTSYRLTDSLRRLPYNINYFRDLFFSEIGMTPAQYLLAKRMDHAQMLIKNRHLSGYSLTEISRNCGFADYYYFSRVFKKQTGFSPREWSER